MENKQNCCLVDWLTFTTKIYSVSDLIELLRMPAAQWEHKQAYRYGYANRCSFSGISILSGGTDEMGVCLEMSGTGCRAFETYSSLSWFELFTWVLDPINECNVTHIDLAFDDHTGILNMDQLLDDTDDHNYRKKGNWWKVEYGSQGSTIYHGSPQSDIRCRIYDKAAERGFLDGSHWIRVELVLRNANAQNAISEILSRHSVGVVFSGVLRNYLCYLVPSSDSNRSRWEIASYWLDLLGSIEPISLWHDPGLEYNIFNLQRYLVDQAGGAFITWAKIAGLDALEDLLKKRNKRLNPKHLLLISQYGKE